MSNCIYQIINHITNDCYVGKTVSSPEIRYKRHLSNAARGDKTYLYSAMRKYGVENFTVNLLEETSEELLSLLEIHYINLLKPSYNMAKGGEGGSTTHLRMWINNGTQNKYILKEEEIPAGYIKGRLCKFNDPEFQKEMNSRVDRANMDYSKFAHKLGNRKSIVIDGIEYKSRVDAIKKLNISKSEFYKLYVYAKNRKD